MKDPHKEAQRLLKEIEKQYPPEKCSLEEYREVLSALRDGVGARINLLDDEIVLDEEIAGGTLDLGGRMRRLYIACHILDTPVAATDGTNGTLTLTYRAGALVRRKLRFELETFCDEVDLKLKLRESKGLIESDYYVTIAGPADRVKRAKAALEKWA